MQGIGNPFHQQQAEGGGGYQQRENGGQQGVGEETDEGIEQNEAIVLQQQKQCQRNAGVVHHQFAGPSLAGVAHAEMHE